MKVGAPSKLILRVPDLSGRAAAFLSPKISGSFCTNCFSVHGSCSSLPKLDKLAPDLSEHLFWHPLGKLSYQRPLCFSVLISLPAHKHTEEGQGQNTSDFKSLTQMFLTQRLLWATNIPRFLCFKSNTFILRNFYWCLNSSTCHSQSIKVWDLGNLSQQRLQGSSYNSCVVVFPVLFIIFFLSYFF